LLRLKYIFIIGLLIFAVPVYSYIINGRVIDQNNFPVPNITVYLSNGSNSGTVKDLEFDRAAEIRDEIEKLKAFKPKKKI
jgi:hypothetical protein